MLKRSPPLKSLPNSRAQLGGQLQHTTRFADSAAGSAALPLVCWLQTCKAPEGLAGAWHGCAERFLQQQSLHLQCKAAKAAQAKLLWRL